MFLFVILGVSSSVRGARAEFGASWNLVLALDVINTLIVLFYLWRIWREKPGTRVIERDRS
jgi:hypothetical protein